jgi:ferric-dicitrate binding protein FerR (iron transport regulator)
VPQPSKEEIEAHLVKLLQLLTLREDWDADYDTGGVKVKLLKLPDGVRLQFLGTRDRIRMNFTVKVP